MRMMIIAILAALAQEPFRVQSGARLRSVLPGGDPCEQDAQQVQVLLFNRRRAAVESKALFVEPKVEGYFLQSVEKAATDPDDPDAVATFLIDDSFYILQVPKSAFFSLSKISLCDSWSSPVYSRRASPTTCFSDRNQ
ncbi:unnamed protein product [Symbiodinium sp. CCMP2592]|nr:unnamed protein product [Symbiodinium sp. CCMP2592]